jgi:hypothetical protein
MKVGRNDPCPCGSGKKYKKCCLKNEATPSKDLFYRRLSEAHDRLVGRLMGYAEKNLGAEAVTLAMDEFLVWPEMEDDFDEATFDRVASLFWPWYLFNWEYNAIDAEEFGITLSVPEELTIAELYVKSNNDRLDPLERRLYECINRKPYSFWEVIDVEPGWGMVMKDVLMGTRINVEERMGSQSVKPGDLLFGRAVSIDGLGMIAGLGSFIIPPGRKPDVIQLRKNLLAGNDTITDATLYDHDDGIREFYLAMERGLHTPPVLCNTDGHSMEFHRLVYGISSADEVFDKLCDLCVTMTPDEMRSMAERDASGKITYVEFPWDRQGNAKHAGMPNTVLGNITIENTRLTAEVNSAERAETLRHDLDTRLKGIGRFKLDEIQDLHAMMSRSPEGPATSSKEHDELIQHPEVQEKLSEMIGKHWESWVDIPIPALGNITPKKAVKTADGREAVEALLKDAERDGRGDPIMAEINRKYTQRVRGILGLNQNP